MAITAYLDDLILNHIFGGATYTQPSTVYASLHTADPGGTGANELSGTGYARVAITFGAASGGTKSNSAEVTFGPNSGGSAWTAVTHMAIWDASTGGNALSEIALGTSKTVAASDSAKFGVGDLDVTAS